jgi:uncharacterized membrane protein YcaP (DUF421 family)
VVDIGRLPLATIEVRPDGRLRRNRLSEHDVLEDLRLNGNVREVRDVALAVFERNGQVSVVRREHQ